MFLNKKQKYHSVRMEYFDTESHLLDTKLNQEEKSQNNNTNQEFGK